MSRPRRCTRLTLTEAVEAILEDTDSDDECDSEDQEGVADICILPPSDGSASETEDVDEDNLAADVPGEVCGKLEIFSRSDATVSTNEAVENDAEKSDDVEPSTSKQPAKRRRVNGKRKVTRTEKKPKKNRLAKWKKGDVFPRPLPESEVNLLVNDHPELIGKSPLELFELFFDQEMFQHLVTQFELYARRDTNKQTFSTTVVEIRQFIGLILLSGYHRLPKERDYWSTSSDLGCSLMTKTMSRNRFHELKRYCHLADNNALGNSKLSKVQPIYDKLNTAFMQFGVFHDKLSIDESMVPYYGHHSAKMFIRGKPVRFGYKLWMLCSYDGYPYKAVIYAGKVDRPVEMTLGEHVVTEFAKLLTSPSNHKLFFDNFFSSYDLFVKLREMGIRATGTTREGRFGDAPFTDKKKFKKTTRGTYEYYSDQSVNAVRWNDNNVVTMLTNFDHTLPVKQVQRHMKGKAGKSQVEQPLMIANYTAGMGGVDLLDRLLGAYRPQIKGKKWWWPLFVNSLNMAVVASWRVHCVTSDEADRMEHLEFRRQIVLGLVGTTDRRRMGGPSAAVIPDVRFDGYEHYLQSTSQGRCATCGSNTRKKCGKCDKRLHELCFQSYHTK